MKIIDKKIRIFNKAIEKYFEAEVDGDILECPAYWHKELFLATLNLDALDWQVIQTDDYWQRRDNLQGMNRNKFILNRVKEYIKQNKQQ